MNLKEQFEAETGTIEAALYRIKYLEKYTEWLEAKLQSQQQPEVSEAFERMLLNEECGGTGWWSGWNALKEAMGVKLQDAKPEPE